MIDITSLNSGDVVEFIINADNEPAHGGVVYVPRRGNEWVYCFDSERHLRARNAYNLKLKTVVAKGAAAWIINMEHREQPRDSWITPEDWHVITNVMRAFLRTYFPNDPHLTWNTP